MRNLSTVLLAITACVTAPMPALAGETVQYAAPPEWAQIAEVPRRESDSGQPVRLVDEQVRLEDGLVTTYHDVAVALENQQMLNAISNISAQWQPDKGDLTIHRVELVRGDTVVDVLASGERFQVLRREAQLERNIIDGNLTATLTVPGVQIGDTIRYSYTTTEDDQALGEYVQHGSAIPTDPAPIERARVIASWPESSEVRFAATRTGSEVEAESRGGYRFVTIEGPVDEMADLPGDAPTRYRLPPMLRLGNFDGYPEISRLMAPLYQVGGTVRADAGIAAEVARIAAASDDPLRRSAMALEVVQDRISYLVNGLDGGNYLPQSPTETWALRYGDCKAKTVLLLAMLAELGVDAEAVLVSTTMGDALPELMPVPLNFNHVIVRAAIDGSDYWLDGTGRGGRFQTIADVPPFRYALPLRSAGTDLIEMPMRAPAIPQQMLSMTLDYSAGIALPALVDAELVVNGPAASQWELVEQMGDTDQSEEAARSAFSGAFDSLRLLDYSVESDEGEATARIRVRGLVDSAWSREGDTYRMSLPGMQARQFSMTSKRSRPEWRDIPVNITAPLHRRYEAKLILPPESNAFTLDNEASYGTAVAGTQMEWDSELKGNAYTITETMRASEPEMPSSQLSQAKRDTLLLRRAIPELVAPRDVRESWDYADSDAARYRPVLDALDRLAADADADDNDALLERADLSLKLGRFEEALADIDAAAAIDPSAEMLVYRAWTHGQLGDIEAALADYEAAQELDPEDQSTHHERVPLLAALGRHEEAIAVADDYALFAEDESDAVRLLALAKGYSGRIDEGLTDLQLLAQDEPNETDILNELCWYSAVWDRVTPETLESCTRAVQRSGSAAAIDSRALAHYRLGQTQEALADLDEAVSAAPDQHASRYLRAYVRKAEGIPGWREDRAIAIRVNPGIAMLYRTYGLTVD